MPFSASTAWSLLLLRVQPSQFGWLSPLIFRSIRFRGRRSSRRCVMKRLFGVLALIGLAAGSYFTRERWYPWFTRTANTGEEAAPLPPSDVKIVKLSEQARKNLGLVSKPVVLSTYWRTILLPGEIVDRPGISDRGITAPAVGAVAEVHAFPATQYGPATSSSRCGCSASICRIRSRSCSRPPARRPYSASNGSGSPVFRRKELSPKSGSSRSTINFVGRTP